MRVTSGVALVSVPAFERKLLFSRAFEKNFQCFRRLRSGRVVVVVRADCGEAVGSVLSIRLST